ncbi:MaoC family dehydratase [Streptomyces sp. NPDC003038]|uniref:MaoC family dehydratase n=1 Tax=unclassified Streptomyces TaxID=2593676 RepID=UPI00339EB28A
MTTTTPPPAPTGRAAAPDYDTLTVGAELEPRTYSLTRVGLVRYAGAAGDFNPIHFSDRSAREAGFPTVIAHGMLTMAKAAELITDWTGDPAALTDFSVRFTRPVPVPDDGSGATLEVRGTVQAKLANRQVRVALEVTCADVKVLTSARATVQL